MNRVRFLSKIAVAASVALALAFTFNACFGGDDGGGDIVFGSFIDERDNQEYKTVEIGMQTWMAQNLNYAPEQIGPTRGVKCYNNNASNCEKFGRLYEWWDAIEVCPAGWYLSTRAEWNDLISYVGNNAGKKLKAASEDWRQETYGTDDYGFGALPGGQITNEEGEIYIAGYWWTATENGDYYSYLKKMDGGDRVGEDYWQKTRQYAVRCLED